MNKKFIIVVVLHMLLSVVLTAVGSVEDFPLGIVSGLTVVFILISLLAAASGTILALQNFRFAWAIALLLAIVAVPALIYYSSLLSRGGLTIGQMIWAGLLYFYVFLAAFFVLTYLENLLGHGKSISNV
jgi:hypothetical protein